MKKTNTGIILILIGVGILCLQGFRVVPIYGNVLLILALIFIVVGFLLFIILSKKSRG